MNIRQYFSIIYVCDSAFSIDEIRAPYSRKVFFLHNPYISPTYNAHVSQQLIALVKRK